MAKAMDLPFCTESDFPNLAKSLSSDSRGDYFQSPGHRIQSEAFHCQEDEGKQRWELRVKINTHNKNISGFRED